MTILIPLSSVSVTDVEQRYVQEAMKSGMISSSGPFVSAFEKALAAQTGVRFVVATASGTSALELALRALGIGAGDEVVVPAFTFAAPALAICLVGATPVFADVTTETWTIDPESVRRQLTPRTRAIIAVDVLGHPCDYDALADIGVPVIEDGAQAHGAAYKGRPIGSLATVAVFSFHANKVISTGEGGCVATDDPALAERVRRLNAFGMDASRRYWHTEIGCKHCMNNVTAAVGLAQVERWDALLAGRARVAAAYDEALAGLPVQRRPVAEWAKESVWLFTIASERRDAILEACHRCGIDARSLWPALPLNPVFQAFDRGDCRRAIEIANRAIWLPTWSDMPIDTVRLVAAAVAEGLSY